jgi:hypothetical protein
MIATQENPGEIVGRALIDDVKQELASLPPTEAPVECTFTPGLMTRRIFMAAGSRILSKIHKTRHQFVILQGAALVSHNGEKPVLMIAPFHGITEPGTWRELFIVMDCIWLTMHPTTKTTVEEVEAEIIASMEDKK